MTRTLQDKIAAMVATWAAGAGSDDHVSAVRSVAHHTPSTWREALAKRQALIMAGGDGLSHPGEVEEIGKQDAMRITLASPQPPATVAEIWAEAHAAATILDNGGYSDAEAISKAQCDALFALEDLALTGPILSLADAVAKLRAVALIDERGEHADRRDFIALGDVIAWLEAAR